MNRHQSRETVFCLLYELEYHSDSHYLDVYNIAKYSRDIAENDYIHDTYCGVCENMGEIDTIINEYAVGWRVDRISRVSRAILRLAVYEIVFNAEVPSNVAINEAVELAKTYDADSAPAFINGILNKVMREQGKTAPAEDAAAESADAAEPEA